MSRMLALLSVIGLSLCAALLGAAWMLGGDNVFHDPRSMEGLKPLIDLATRKEWHWAGGDTLALDAPIHVRYEPHGAPNVTVTGPADAMDHIRFRAGRIASTNAAPRDTSKVQAVVSGVPIRKFVVNPGESLQLGHVDQDELTIHVNGEGAVGGDGKVGHLTLVMSGPGAANLGALQVGDADVSILGPGQATLSPHGAVNLFAIGGSKVAFLTRPESLQRRLWGGAMVRTPDGIEEPEPIRLPRDGRPARPATPATPPTPPGAVPLPMEAPVQVQVPVVVPPMPGVTPREAFLVPGSGHTDLGHIDQERLTISIAGSGSATAQGRVDTLVVQIMGSGHASLAGLKARHVSVEIAGPGNAIVAPTDDVKVNILGSGNVRLTTRPAQIERHIVGSGHLIEAR